MRIDAVPADCKSSRRLTIVGDPVDVGNGMSKVLTTTYTTDGGQPTPLWVRTNTIVRLGS